MRIRSKKYYFSGVFCVRTKWTISWTNYVNYIYVRRSEDIQGTLSFSEVFCEKTCSLNFLKTPVKTAVPESLLYKVAGLTPATLFKKDSGTGVFL